MSRRYLGQWQLSEDEDQGFENSIFLYRTYYGMSGQLKLAICYNIPGSEGDDHLKINMQDALGGTWMYAIFSEHEPDFMIEGRVLDSVSEAITLCDLSLTKFQYELLDPFLIPDISYGKGGIDGYSVE